MTGMHVSTPLDRPWAAALGSQASLQVNALRAAGWFEVVAVSPIGSAVGD
jgi:hypothetical protein